MVSMVSAKKARFFSNFRNPSWRIKKCTLFIQQYNLLSSFDFFMGNKPSVEFPLEEEACIPFEPDEKCYICWETINTKDFQLIRSPCQCRIVVHNTCLLNYIKFSKKFRCSVCDDFLFEQGKRRRLSKRKKLRLTMEAIQQESGGQIDGVHSPGCRLTPTCSVFGFFR